MDEHTLNLESESISVQRPRSMRRVLVGIMAGLLLGFVVLIGLWLWHLGSVHQHCIKMAGTYLSGYADAHHGEYPSHANGFGDALALMAADIGYTSGAMVLVGVDDDASLLMAAATNHTHLPEEKCTRIYVQGMTEASNPQIAILFDRYAVKGGDHRRGNGPYLREVLFVHDGVREIELKNWPAFASNQVELLVQEGIARPVAEAYYAPTLRPDAIR